MLLHEVVDRVAASRSGDAAVVHGEVTITFGELAARIHRTAAAVAAATEPGARVAVIGENHPVWIDCMYGVPAAGRVLVFLNHRLSVPELGSILGRSGATAVIGSTRELDRLPPGGPPVLWSFDGGPSAPAAAAGGDAAVGGDGRAAAWLIYTSGTTARPKGAVLTHRSLLSAVRVTAAARPA
ncbi:MAG TPA: AMP-binding protein, partial [Acidimicrobiales bacterium]